MRIEIDSIVIKFVLFYFKSPIEIPNISITELSSIFYISNMFVQFYELTSLYRINYIIELSIIIPEYTENQYSNMILFSNTITYCHSNS